MAAEGCQEALDLSNLKSSGLWVSLTDSIMKWLWALPRAQEEKDQQSDGWINPNHVPRMWQKIKAKVTPGSNLESETPCEDFQTGETEESLKAEKFRPYKPKDIGEASFSAFRQVFVNFL
ncbi:hypothetical protein NC651_005134 [Populus alba x Populus x berolinensis]|nr:hypothetical protein NC651_005134 [Populus alba x Populus x berolinensis]